MINGLWFQQLLEIALIFRTIKTRDVDFSLKFPVIQETNYGLAHIFAALHYSPTLENILNEKLRNVGD